MNITDTKVTEYINGLYKPINPFLDELRRKAESENIPIILRETETLLLTLLEILKPEHILEIGTAVGYSALCFAISRPDAAIITLEIREQMRYAAESNFAVAGMSDNIKLMQGDALESLSLLVSQRNNNELKPFDFIFIDGAKGHYQEIWNVCRQDLCKDGTVIVSDNVLYKAMTAADEYLDIRRNKTIVNRMRGFLEHITSQPDVTTTVLPVGDGIAVSVIGERR